MKPAACKRNADDEDWTVPTQKRATAENKPAQNEPARMSKRWQRNSSQLNQVWKGYLYISFPQAVSSISSSMVFQKERSAEIRNCPLFLQKRRNTANCQKFQKNSASSNRLHDLEICFCNNSCRPLRRSITSDRSTSTRYDSNRPNFVYFQCIKNGI